MSTLFSCLRSLLYVSQYYLQLSVQNRVTGWNILCLLIQTTMSIAQHLLIILVHIRGSCRGGGICPSSKVLPPPQPPNPHPLTLVKFWNRPWISIITDDYQSCCYTHHTCIFIGIRTVHYMCNVHVHVHVPQPMRAIVHSNIYLLVMPNIWWLIPHPAGDHHSRAVQGLQHEASTVGCTLHQISTED